MTKWKGGCETQCVLRECVENALSLIVIQGAFRFSPTPCANFDQPVRCPSGVILSLPCMVKICGLAFFCRIFTKLSALTVMVRLGLPIRSGGDDGGRDRGIQGP